MSDEVKPNDTMEAIAYRMLGDRRLTHELVIPGWHGQGEPPVGQKVYLRDEKIGPPTRNWTQPR